MPLEFDLSNITVTEFGVGRDGDDGWLLVRVPIDSAVQAALRDMAVTTWNEMENDTDDPAHYQPSEKHASVEYLRLARGSDLEIATRQIYDAENLPPDATAMQEPAEIVYYFACFLDVHERRLVGLTWIIREDGDSGGDTGASVWYKRCAHKRLATTEAPA